VSREGQAGGSDKEFAVLLPILDREGAPSILFTKRPDTLPEYSGHISFPGGVRDAEDRDLEATALRETFEEVGIEPGRIQVLRELGWQRTSLGHRVKPFVGRVAPGPIRPSPIEVERVIYLPLTALAVPEPFGTRTWKDIDGRPRVTYTILCEGLEVWGLTARILREFWRTGMVDG